MDTQNESDAPVITSMELDDGNSNTSVCVHLGGMHWHAGDLNGCIRGPGRCIEGTNECPEHVEQC